MDGLVQYETHTVTFEGLTVPRLIWRRFKRPMPGYLEKVLDFNQGLSASVTIPVGTVVAFPLDPLVETPKSRKAEAVRLWD